MELLRKMLWSEKLDADQQREFEYSMRLNTASHIKFLSVVVLFVTAFFSLVDYLTVNSHELFISLVWVRVIFVLFFLFPFAIYFVRNQKPIPQLILFINGLGYAVFLFILSFMVQSEQQAVFHNTIGLFLVNIGIFLLLGLKEKYAIFISAALFAFVNFNFIHISKGYTLSITLADVDLWYIIVTLVSCIFALHLKVIQKKAFVINAELKQANHSRYNLFNIVSHDLKNIISAQTTITDYLQSVDNRLSDKERTQFLALLNKSSNDALSMFEDLMIWIKSQMEIIKPVISEINLHDFVMNQVEYFKMVAENKNLTINAEQIDLLGIKTDATILSLVFRNILSNAIKYSENGSKIDISALKNPYGFKIRVKDHGIGIPKDKLEDLFKLDKHITTSGTRGEKGTGLGLVLTKDLLSHIRGNINIQSTFGQGTTVILEIPAFDEFLN